jgi:Flp pilus assembly protein TadD
MRGSLHAFLKQYREGIQDFQMGEKLRSNQPSSMKPKEGAIMSASGLYRAGEVFMWAGVAYTGTGDYRNALREFTKAIAFSPSPKMYSLRAETYTKMGEKEKARADLISARRAVDPNDYSGAVNNMLYAR